MNRGYRKELFNHLDGIVLIPTLNSLFKTKIIDTINSKNKFTIDDLSNNTNKGYLKVALRLLYSLKFLNSSNNNTYTADDSLKEVVNNFDTFKEIEALIKYHIKFNELNNDDFKKYSKIIINLINHLKQNNISNNLRKNISGIIIGPILANLSFNNIITKNGKHLEFTSMNSDFIDALFKLFVVEGFI